MTALSAAVRSRGAMNRLLGCPLSWEIFFRAADGEEATNVKEGKTLRSHLCCFRTYYILVIVRTH